MRELSQQEKSLALTNVLEVLGLAVRRAQGQDQDGAQNLTTGIIIIEFKDDGDYCTNKAGFLSKGLVMGALMDSILAYREQSQAQAVGELFDAMIESADTPDDKLN